MSDERELLENLVKAIDTYGEQHIQYWPETVAAVNHLHRTDPTRTICKTCTGLDGKHLPSCRAQAAGRDDSQLLSEYNAQRNFPAAQHSTKTHPEGETE